MNFVVDERSPFVGQVHYQVTHANFSKSVQKVDGLTKKDGKL